MSFVEVGSLSVGDKFKRHDIEYLVTNIERDGRIIAHTTKDWFDQIILTPGIIVEVKEEGTPMLGKFKQNLYRVTIAGKLKWTFSESGDFYYTYLGNKRLRLFTDGNLQIPSDKFVAFKFEKLLRCIEEVKQKENVVAELLPILERM